MASASPRPIQRLRQGNVRDHGWRSLDRRKKASYGWILRPFVNRDQDHRATRNRKRTDGRWRIAKNCSDLFKSSREADRASATVARTAPSGSDFAHSLRRTFERPLRRTEPSIPERKPSHWAYSCGQIASPELDPRALRVLLLPPSPRPIDTLSLPRWAAESHLLLLSHVLSETLHPRNLGLSGALCGYVCSRLLHTPSSSASSGLGSKPVDWVKTGAAALPLSAYLLASHLGARVGLGHPANAIRASLRSYRDS